MTEVQNDEVMFCPGCGCPIAMAHDFFPDGGREIYSAALPGDLPGCQCHESVRNLTRYMKWKSLAGAVVTWDER